MNGHRLLLPAVATAAWLLAACASAPTPPRTATVALTPARSPTAVPLPTARVAPSPVLSAAVRLPDPVLAEAADVVNVVDGDTVDVRGGGGEQVRVRLYGVDTPERGERCFQEATDRTRALVDGRVLLLPDARERDPYGRLLRYVFTPQGQSVDAELVAEGLAYAWRRDGAYRDEIVALEQQAQAAGAGCLWDR